MATTLFRNLDLVLTLSGVAKKSGRKPGEKDLGIKKKQTIVAVGGKIAWVGSNNKIPKEFHSGKEVNLQGHTILPAFAECHTHLVFAGLRADEFELRNTGVSYSEIAKRGGGILSTVKATRKASHDQLLELAQKRLDRFVAQGVTTVEVKSGYALRLKDELKMLKVAKSLKKARVVTTYLGAHAIPPEKKSAKEYIEELIVKDLKKVKGVADRADIFIEKGFFDKKLGESYLQKAKDMGLTLTIHADQISRTGAGSLGVDLGAQSIDHLVQINQRDIQKIAKSETTAVLLPAADYYLKMKYPPARKLIDAGARVALATDFNPGSSPMQDLATVGLMGRLEMGMSLPEVIAAYTYNAAAALGLAGELGSLEVGKKCDFVALDADWRELFYSMGHTPVHSVWREGRRIHLTR